MQKILSIDPEKCTGCRLCETVCSIQHEKTCTPETSRIKIVKWENEGIYLPMVCQQCDIPVCQTVCPMHAIKRDPETQAVVIDEQLCVGCRLCIQFCPLGCVGVNQKTKKIIKCDLCGGEPICVRFCQSEAIQYLDASTLNTKKRRVAAKRFSDYLKKLLITV